MRGGLYIPDTAKEKPQQGEIVGVGPGKYDENGKRVPMDVKAGDKVLYGKKYKGIIRSSFVIDDKGKIKSAHYKVSPKGHADAMLEAV